MAAVPRQQLIDRGAVRRGIAHSQMVRHPTNPDFLKLTITNGTGAGFATPVTSCSVGIKRSEADGEFLKSLKNRRGARDV